MDYSVAPGWLLLVVAAVAVCAACYFLVRALARHPDRAFPILGVVCGVLLLLPALAAVSVGAMSSAMGLHAVVKLGALVAACVAFAFLVRHLARNPGSRTPVAIAGALLLIPCVLAALWVSLSRDTPSGPSKTATVAAPPPAVAAHPTSALDFSRAWTDKYPPRTGQFPEWVASKELAEPADETLPVAGLQVAFPGTDAQGRLAGFSDFQPTKEEASTQAWACLAARLEKRVLARCALLQPRELPSYPTRLGSLITRGIRPEIEARRASLCTLVFEDEVEVAALGTVYRAALGLTDTGRAVESIADVVIKKAAEDERRMQADMRQARAARERELKEWAYGIGGALFLLLIITSVYLFLNAQTKGYYAWPLRIVAFVIYIAAVAAFFLFFRTLAGR
jgi:hypothetical protein